MSGGQIMCWEFPSKASEDGGRESIAKALNKLRKKLRSSVVGTFAGRREI
jgi:hypothetical protein